MSDIELCSEWIMHGYNGIDFVVQVYSARGWRGFLVYLGLVL